MHPSRSRIEKPKRALFSGEQRAILAVAFQLEGWHAQGGQLAQAAERLGAFRTAVVGTVAAAGGQVITALHDVALGIWGLSGPVASDTPVAVEQTVRLVRERLGPHTPVRAGIEAGVAVILYRDDHDRQPITVSEAIDEALRLTTEGTCGRADIEHGPLFARLRGAKTQTGGEPSVTDYLAVAQGTALLGTLGSVADLARLLAVLGSEPDLRLAAEVIGISRGSAARGCAALVQAGVLGEARTFASPAIRDALGRTVVETDRTRIHARALDVLEGWASGPHPPLALVIARHADNAGVHVRAAHWWCEAAVDAQERDDLSGAVRYYEHALSAIDATPAAESSGMELEILGRLAPLLGAVRGNAAPEVVEIYQRCVVLRDRHRNGHDDLGFDSLWGLQAAHLVRAEISVACGLGARLIETAERRNCDILRVVAHRMQGLACLLDGRLSHARRHYETVLGLYRPEHAGLRFRYASDQRAVALAGLAWLETIAGRTNAAQHHAAAAMLAADRINHPHTTAHVKGVLAACAQTVGDEQKAFALARTTRRVARESGLPYWVAWADLVLGWAESFGSPLTGLARITSAISAYEATGARQALSYAHLLLADGEYRAGRPAAARVTIARASRMSCAGAVRLYLPEILRKESEIIGATERESGPALHLVREAYGLAIGRDAQLFANRAVETLLQFMGGDCDANWIRNAVRDSS